MQKIRRCMPALKELWFIGRQDLRSLNLNDAKFKAQFESMVQESPHRDSGPDGQERLCQRTECKTASALWQRELLLPFLLQFSNNWMSATKERPSAASQDSREIRLCTHLTLGRLGHRGGSREGGGPAGQHDPRAEGERVKAVGGSRCCLRRDRSDWGRKRRAERAGAEGKRSGFWREVARGPLGPAVGPWAHLKPSC